MHVWPAMVVFVLRIAEPLLRSCGPPAITAVFCGYAVEVSVQTPMTPITTARLHRRRGTRLSFIDPPQKPSPMRPLLSTGETWCACTAWHQSLRVPAEVLEHLHARIALIRDEDLVALVDEQPGRQQELPRVRAAVADKQQELPFRVEDLEVVERGVGDVDVPFAVHGDALGTIEGAGRVAERAEHADERAMLVEDLHAEVQRVRDVQPPKRVHGDVGRKVELAGLAAAAPDGAEARAVDEIQHLAAAIDSQAGRGVEVALLAYRGGECAVRRVREHALERRIGHPDR